MAERNSEVVHLAGPPTRNGVYPPICGKENVVGDHGVSETFRFPCRCGEVHTVATCRACLDIKEGKMFVLEDWL